MSRDITRENANNIDEYGNSRVYNAVRNSIYDLAEELIEKGADIYRPGSDGRSALHVAAAQGNLRMLRLLIRAADYLDLESAEGLTPLAYAILNKNFPNANALIKAGADINSTKDENGNLFHTAAILNEVDILNFLLENIPKRDIRKLINERNKKGETPLHMSMENMSMDVLPILVSRGADITVVANNGYSPIARMIHMKQGDMLEKLLELAYDKKYMYGNTLLHVFCAMNISVRRLLEKNVDVNAKNVHGMTPLHFALRFNVENIKALLEAGADPNAQNRLKMTPLHYASMYRRVPPVTLLLDHGADKTKKDVIGFTPLNYAVMNFNYAIASLLSR